MTRRTQIRVVLRAVRVATLCLIPLALWACGSPPPPAAPPPPPAAPPPAPEPVDAGPSSVEGEIGGLNEEAMARAFQSLDRPVQACLDEATGKLPVLGGRFNLKIRIDREGRARWAYLSETTLGDRDAERCVLALVKEKQWPRPIGGEGVAERAYEIDPKTKPAVLEVKWVRPAVTKAAQNAWRCKKKGARGKLRATAYLRPDGRVLAASIAPPNERVEDAADCVVEAIRKVQFGRPGRRSKLSFDIQW